MSEHIAQVFLVSWLRQNYPDYWVFAIPNGGGRTRSQGAKLKAEGVSPGVPDLFIPRAFLWVEMKKTKKEKLKDNQVKWKKHLTQYGYHYMVGYGLNDAKEKLRGFFTLISGDPVNFNLLVANKAQFIAAEPVWHAAN